MKYCPAYARYCCCVHDCARACVSNVERSTNEYLQYNCYFYLRQVWESGLTCAALATVIFSLSALQVRCNRIACS
jgi:hypothetical protein